MADYFYTADPTRNGTCFATHDPTVAPTPVPSTVVIDTHDAEEKHKRERKRFRERNEKLREDLVSAYNRTFGISIPDETEPAEVVQAIEENFRQISEQDIAEVEKRVLEKLVSEYREYEKQKRIYDRKMLEDEWDTDAMLAIAHLLQ